MHFNAAALFTLGAFAITGVQAAGVGNAAARVACKGFPKDAIKCLTDVSYVICSGQVNGKEVEQFVAPGTHCEQGIPGQKIDVVNASGPATATRVFVQHSKDGAAVSSYVPPSLRPEYTKTAPFDFRETTAAAA